MRKSMWMAIGVVVTVALASLAMLQAQETAPPASAPAASQAAAPIPVPEGPVADLWSNFLHYIRMARPELAQAYGQAILNANPAPTDLYALAMKTDQGGTALARGRTLNPDLGKIVDQISSLINKGAIDARTNPAEIGRWIQMIGDESRKFRNAVDKLVLSGEYAVPQMIAALADQKTPELLRERLRAVLPLLGKEGVRPLCESLSVEDPAVKESVIWALQEIGYPVAAPYLKEVAEQKDLVERVRQAADTAIIKLIGPERAKKPTAELFYEFSEKYYNHEESLMSDSRYPTGNVWYWQPRVGLTFKIVPAPIFADLYAMRLSRKALEHDAAMDAAVALWLASNYRREADLPAGQPDPTAAPDAPSADYYGLAAGANYLQAVLVRATKANEVKVIRKALDALSRTASAATLARPVNGGASPAVALLTYPARPVRYMAAIVLTNANPQEKFEGTGMVVAVLTEALRQTAAQTVALVDAQQERRNKVKDMLRQANFKVVDAATLAGALEQGRAIGGVDLVLIASDVTGPGLGECLTMLRAAEATHHLPVVVLTRPSELEAVRTVEKNDSLVASVRADELQPADVTAAIAKVQKAAAGGDMTEDESVDWAVMAANALQNLAANRNPVYDLAPATKSLIAALGDSRDRVRIAAAAALGRFNAAEGQQALAALALGDAPEPIRLAAFAALANSARTFGKALDDKTDQAIVATVNGAGSPQIKEAAAEVLGILSLPSQQVKPLILARPVIGNGQAKPPAAPAPAPAPAPVPAPAPAPAPVPAPEAAPAAAPAPATK